MNWCSLTLLQLAILGSGVILVSPSWGHQGADFVKTLSPGGGVLVSGGRSCINNKNSPPASQVFQFSDMKLKPSNSGLSSPVIGMIKNLPAAQLLLGKLRYLHLFLARDQQN